MKILDIIKEEAARGGYTVAQILADDRTLRITKLRQYAMWRARAETSRSLAEIGLMFKRDHTTVLYAYQKIEAMRPDARVALPPTFPVPPRFASISYGARRYLGRECSRCHGRERYVANSGCVECKRLNNWTTRHAKNSLGTRDGRADKALGCVAVEQPRDC
jgi:hypothetical protein